MEPTIMEELDLANITRVRGAEQSGNATIARISGPKREKCGAMYIPRTFCIGPLHKETEVQNVKSKKTDFLIDFLDRQGKMPSDRPRILASFLKNVNELEERAKSVYSENLAFNQNAFSNMLLLDGIFILEVLLKHYDGTLKGELSPFTIEILKRDLILLENQIPFIVLENLCEALYKSYEDNLHNTGSQISQPNLVHLAMNFFELRILHPNNRANDKIGHLLDLIYRGFVPVYSSTVVLTQMQDTDTKFSRSIQSATQLKEFGVNLEVDPKANFLEVKFESGTLKVFFLELDERKTCIYANLVALEEVNDIIRKPVTSLCYLFKSLIRNDEDVSLLVRHNVIENIYGTDAEIKDLFSNICLDTSLEPDNHHLSVVFKNIQLYCDKKWHRWWAVFKREFFRWPWSVAISVWSLFLVANVIVQFYLKVKREKHK